MLLDSYGDFMNDDLAPSNACRRVLVHGAFVDHEHFDDLPHCSSSTCVTEPQGVAHREQYQRKRREGQARGGGAKQTRYVYYPDEGDSNGSVLLCECPLELQCLIFL